MTFWCVETIFHSRMCSVTKPSKNLLSCSDANSLIHQIHPPSTIFIIHQTIFVVNTYETSRTFYLYSFSFFLFFYFHIFLFSSRSHKNFKTLILKLLHKYKQENERLRAENRALTRVVSKLTTSAQNQLLNKQ